MLEQIVENIGLTKKEARVYLAALEIGSNPVSKIAAKAKINRVTTYDIMEKLSKRGFVTSFTRAKVKYYSATDPELIVNDFKKKVEDLEVSLPVLKQLNGEAGSKPQVMTYEGFDAIKTIYKDILSTDKGILMYANIAEIEKYWSSFMEDFERKRMDYEIPMKLIAVRDERGNFFKEYDDEFQRETRLIPKADFTGNIAIYDGKTAIISWKTNIGILIDDPEITKTHRTLFRLNWEKSEPSETTMVVRKVGKVKPREEKEIFIREDQGSLF